MRQIVWLMVAVVVAGCAATGVKVDPARLATLRRGETTYPQAIAVLGQPTSQTRLGDGSSVVVYSYAQYSTRPETFLPFIGAFVGGADMRSSAVVLRFSADGRLQSVTSSESAYGAGTGLLSGAGPVAPTNQPLAP